MAYFLRLTAYFIMQGIIDAIGNTPLIRLRRVVEGVPDGVEIYAKAEHLNPGGSVKDRAARGMINEAVKSGKLTPDKIILDATSGNTGIALGMIGASLGFRVALCLPENATIERKRILRNYGAEIIETSALESSDGAQRRAIEIAQAEPEKYFYIDQYNNAANWQAHYHTTASEIWKQTEGRITHFVAGIGTAGTLVGIGRRLRELKPRVRLLAMQPDSPLHGLEGMRHLGSTMVPGIYDASVSDATLEVATEDAFAMTKRLAREEGLLVGVSAGGNVCAAIELARTLASGSVVVTILCDTGSRYLSEHFWDEVN